MKILMVLASRAIDFLESDYDYFVAVDGGYDLLTKKKIECDLFVGDCDSINTDEIVAKKKIILDPIKDETDFAYARRVINDEFPAAEVTVIGGTGGRLDHF
jgi:thiamine pyrophosphokinase